MLMIVDTSLLPLNAFKLLSTKIYLKTRTNNLLSNAVSSCQDVLVVNERATAELATVVEQGSNPRPLVDVRVKTVDNPKVKVISFGFV